MSSTKLASFSVVLASIALLYGVVNTPATGRATHEAQPRAFRDPAQETAIADLARRLVELERHIEELRLLPPQALTTQRQSVDHPSTADQAMLDRLRVVEKTLLGIRSTQTGLGPGGETIKLSLSQKSIAAAREQKMADLHEMVRTWSTSALDPTKSVGVRMSALKGLRGNHLADGTDARLPVVRAMIHMAQSSSEGSVRANVWRQMDGVLNPDLMSALLHALANDLYPDAREEAAESLGPYLPDSRVESALRSAAEYDADKGVRRQAKKSLSEGLRR